VSANLLRERISLRGSCRAVAVSRQRLAFHVGGRSRERAQARGANLPQGYQHHATFHPEASITVSATPDDLFHQAKEPK
jgi:hypothetical protein